MKIKKLLTPADVVILVYVAIACVLIALFHARDPYWWMLIAAHLVIAGIVSAVALWEYNAVGRSRSEARIASIVHGWQPVPLIFAVYHQLRILIPLVHPHDLDIALAKLDHRIFGVYPTVWLERWSFPLATELLQLAYATYYFLPLGLGFLLWRHARERFYLVFFALTLGFVLSYFGYMLVPAIGPRYTPLILQAQTQPLQGLWLFSQIRGMLDIGEGITRDCFPSGHTEITLITLIYAFRFERKYFWWILPIGSMLIVSTVYLRYHYVVDVVAGALLAVFVVFIANTLSKPRTTDGMTSATSSA